MRVALKSNIFFMKLTLHYICTYGMYAAGGRDFLCRQAIKAKSPHIENYEWRFDNFAKVE